MLKVPNRHAAVFNPVQQAKMWESRILAEEKALGIKPVVHVVPSGAKPVPAEPSVTGIVPLSSDKKPAHFYNHRGLEPPATPKPEGACGVSVMVLDLCTPSRPCPEWVLYSLFYYISCAFICSRTRLEPEPVCPS